MKLIVEYDVEVCCDTIWEDVDRNSKWKLVKECVVNNYFPQCLRWVEEGVTIADAKLRRINVD